MPPTELTEKLRQEICNNVLIGMPPRAAAEQAGVDRDEFAEWTRRGRKGEEPFAGLLREMKAAELTAQRHLVASVSKAAGRDPKVALQVLALRWPDEWSEHRRERSAQVEVESPSTEDIKVLVSRMAPRFPLLHWENRVDFEALIGGLVAEFAPQGPLEEHLIEELAGIVQLRNRFRLAEAAAHRQGLKDRLPEFRGTVKAALGHMGETKPQETLSDALTATDEETEELLAGMREEEAEVLCVVKILETDKKDRYDAAQKALGRNLVWWTNALARNPLEYEKESLYKPTPEELLRFLQSEILTWYPTRTQELANRQLIRDQAFGESLNAEAIEKLQRAESYLDRRFESGDDPREARRIDRGGRDRL